MATQSDDQLRFDIDAPRASAGRQRRKRRRRAPQSSDSRPKSRQPNDGNALLRTPQATRCGFCGSNVTVFEDAVICPTCGSVVSRPPEEQ